MLFIILFIIIFYLLPLVSVTNFAVFKSKIFPTFVLILDNSDKSLMYNTFNKYLIFNFNNYIIKIK